MSRKPSPHPNEVEMNILGVLWRLGPSTAREIHEALQADRDAGISSTTKMLHVMTAKGLVTRNRRQRPIRFSPADPPEVTQAGIVGDIVDRVFGGAAEKLIVRAMETNQLSAGQLAEIRRLIDRVEGESP